VGLCIKRGGGGPSPSPICVYASYLKSNNLIEIVCELLYYNSNIGNRSR